MRDIMQKITQEQIEEVIQLFNPYMDDYLYLMDLKTDYYRISKHAVDRFLLPSDSFSDAFNMHQQFVYAEDFPYLSQDFDLLLTGKKKSHNLHYRWLDRNKMPIWINCRGTVLDDEDGTPHYLIGCINETGKKQRANNISGLLGESELTSYVMSNAKDKPVCGFLMRLGIDDFNAIHVALDVSYGNYVIRSVADCIQQCLTESQRLFHITFTSGEYMIVDFDSHTQEDAVVLYRSIQEKIAAFIASQNYKSVFTLSAGIIELSVLSSHFEDFIKLSDFALDQSRFSYGKNSYYIFDQTDYDTFLHRAEITTALYHAVNNNFAGFDVYYQPIIDCESHRLLSAEALMRFSMPSADGGKPVFISPLEFIPILEETGLILPAGKWILNEAFSMCSDMQQYIPGFTVNVNLSYIQVIKSNVIKDILSAMNTHKLPPECIGIELTESGYLDTNQHFVQFRNALKENGIHFILDDFGTGYSNLHCLSDLNPAYIKIDRSFTNKAIINTYDHELIVKIIEMSHRLDLKICIEGVEKPEVLEEFQKMHADFIQGYLFGKPCCRSEFFTNFVSN